MPASSDSQIGMQATDVTRQTETTKAMEISLFSWSSPEEQRLSALWFLAILAERLESGNLPVFRNKCTLGIPLLTVITTTSPVNISWALTISTRHCVGRVICII